MGDGREEEVEEAVDDGHVEGHDEDDGGAEEHFQGADDAASKDGGFAAGSRADFVVTGAELWSAELDLETLGLPLDEDAGIGLLVEDFDHDTYKAGGHEKNPENPPPAGTLRYEASSDRSNDWSEERSEAVKRSR